MTDSCPAVCGVCGCTQEKQDRNLLQLVSDIYESCVEQIGPELEAAVEEEDDEALEGLRDQLATYCEVVDAGFSKLAVKQQSQIWLQVGSTGCTTGPAWWMGMYLQGVPCWMGVPWIQHLPRPHA
jgi:hypothetical protein